MKKEIPLPQMGLWEFTSTTGHSLKINPDVFSCLYLMALGRVFIVTNREEGLVVNSPDLFDGVEGESNRIEFEDIGIAFAPDDTRTPTPMYFPVTIEIIAEESQY